MEKSVYGLCKLGYIMDQNTWNSELPNFFVIFFLLSFQQNLSKGLYAEKSIYVYFLTWTKLIVNLAKS
jgi:hypothetical protein